jgi:hypothetical protein
MQDVAYTVADDGETQGLPRTGMFSAGRVVWLPTSETSTDVDTVTVYAEGIGTVSIHRDSLGHAVK